MVWKSGVLQHKIGNISETRKDRGKVTMHGGPIGTHERSFERYHPRPHTVSPLPQDWVFATPPKTPIAIISGTGKATNFQFRTHIYRLMRNKSPLKISGKVAVGVVRDFRKFSGHPYIGRIARSSLR